MSDNVSVKWSPDLDDYATGKVGVAGVRCALCANAPCGCPPFGSAEYLALIDKRHGRK